jgi:hypothetical protein
MDKATTTLETCTGGRSSMNVLHMMPGFNRFALDGVLMVT